MSRLLWLFIRKDYQQRYPTSWAIWGELLAMGMTWVIYWYTSRAFSPSIQALSGEQNYFIYIVVGEIFLWLPMAVFETPVHSLRQAASEGTLDHYLISSRGIHSFLNFTALSTVFREMIRTLATFLLMKMIFPEKFFLVDAPILIGSLMTMVPVCLGLGLLAAALFLQMGRGHSAISFVSTGSMILAGAYFPITVFPEWIARHAHFFSPFTYFLQTMRNYLNSGRSFTGVFSPLLALGMVGILFVLVGRWGLDVSLERLRKNNGGTPRYLR